MFESKSCKEIAGKFNRNSFDSLEEFKLIFIQANFLKIEYKL